MAVSLLNGSTEWLGVTGLSIEILGLALLFYDLLKSKISDQSDEVLQVFLSDLETSRHQTLFNMHGAFTSLTKAASQIIKMDAGTVPADLRKLLISTFENAQESLISEEKLKAALAAELAASGSILHKFNQQNQLSSRLLKVARMGIALVLIGAAMQLLDVAFFDFTAGG